MFRQIAQATGARFVFLSYGAGGAATGPSTDIDSTDYEELALDDLVVRLVAEEVAALTGDAERRAPADPDDDDDPAPAVGRCLHRRLTPASGAWHRSRACQEHGDDSAVHRVRHRVEPEHASRSAIACSGETTLIVVIPIAFAGLRLMPRSSRNTTSSGSTPAVRQASS